MKIRKTIPGCICKKNNSTRTFANWEIRFTIECKKERKKLENYIGTRKLRSLIRIAGDVNFPSFLGYAINLAATNRIMQKKIIIYNFHLSLGSSCNGLAWVRRASFNKHRTLVHWSRSAADSERGPLSDNSLIHARKRARDLSCDRYELQVVSQFSSSTCNDEEQRTGDDR